MRTRHRVGRARGAVVQSWNARELQPGETVAPRARQFRDAHLFTLYPADPRAPDTVRPRVVVEVSRESRPRPRDRAVRAFHADFDAFIRQLLADAPHELTVDPTTHKERLPIR